MKTYIGCSGFSYKDWKEKFYPEDLPSKEWLPYYAEHFNTVEINNTFYKQPSEELLENWVKQTPKDFRFSIKAHRYLTHQKKLKIDDAFLEGLDRFQKVLEPIKEKLGVVLWQLPGNLHENVSKIREFLEKLDKDVQHAIEFRHDSWFSDSVYETLKKHNTSFCILSAPKGLPEDTVVTSKTVYLRFHGKKSWYNYLYSEKELKEWSDRLKKLKNVNAFYIYFNNDVNANAVKNALALKKMMNA